MKKIFTFAAALLASVSLWATSVSELSFNEPTALPEGYVYSSTNTPVIATVGQKSSVYVTNGGGGSVTAACFSEDGLVAGQGKRWMGFIADEESSVVISVYSSQKTWTLYKSDGTAFATYTNVAKNTWEDWAIETLPAGQYILTAGSSQCYVSAITFTGGTPSTDPVESAEISGENACLLGGSVELTCVASKATNYQWLMDGVAITGADTKKYTFTPSAAGTYSFTCEAWNEYNTSHAVSAAFAVSVLDPANIYGQIIKATLTSGSAATVTGLIGGTADVSLSSSKKMDKGKYFGITLASGGFKEGDTVVITMTTAGSNYPCLFEDKEKTNCLYLATETSSDLEYRIVLPAAAEGINSLYLARDADDATYKWNPVLASIEVIRPEHKTIVSTVETLTAVTINDVAISATDLASLVSNTYLFLQDAYVTAPVVKFTKHTVITYDDQSTKVKDEVIEVTSQPATTTWGASATINGNSYYVYTSKAASRTVTYMYGEQVLGTETVAFNGNPAEYAQYETMPLATFGGWYKDADLTQAVANIAAEVISADATYYAAFDKAYAQSIDFEGMVINQGTKYDVKSALTAHFYDYKTIDALDSLNNSKGAARNEPYLGLKIKKQGGYLACNVQPGTTIRIKFGYVAETVLAIAGGDTLRLNPTDNKIADQVFPIQVETLVKLQTTSDKTVVIKQIMIDQPIATWMYPITYAEAEHGTVSGWTIAYPGEEVKVTYTREDGYRPYSLTYNGVALHDDDNVGYVTFTMPSEAVNVEASFVTEFPTAIDNTEADVKAVKVVRNGQLFIEKNGVLYNAQGAVVK